jgi:signal transduction histidine kinase
VTPHPHGGFAHHLADRIATRSEALTRDWIDILRDQLEVDARDVFPSDDLLNHIPDILDRVAAFIADPETALLEALVVEDLSRLADLRRRQGFGVRELLREYRILGDTLQEQCEEAAREYDGPDSLVDVVSAVGRLKDATHLMSAITARSFRLWQGRYDRERQDLLETYGRVLSHELGNRLGAAETAVRLLQSDIDIEPERAERLLELALESIQRGLRTVDDIDSLGRPVSLSSKDSSIGLSLLVTESVRLARTEAEQAGISVEVEGTIPAVRVAGPPVRVALSNLLGNAIKYHRSEGNGRWVRLRTATGEGELVFCVEDNGPGIPGEDRERVFHQYFRGNVEEDGSGLGLAITRDAIERVGGSVTLREGRAGGALFEVRVPVVEDGASSTG